MEREYLIDEKFRLMDARFLEVGDVVVDISGISPGPWQPELLTVIEVSSSDSVIEVVLEGGDVGMWLMGGEGFEMPVLVAIRESESSVDYWGEKSGPVVVNITNYGPPPDGDATVATLGSSPRTSWGGSPCLPSGGSCILWL